VSRKGVAVLLLLAGSEAVGVAAGQWFLLLFERNAPGADGALSGLARTHFAFLGSGALLGLVIFGWALLAVASARLFAGARRQEDSRGAPGPQ
jgi:hypothetical protein